MTPINRKPAQQIKPAVGTKHEGYGAAISTTFATLAMTTFLWTQIVSGLVPPVS